MTNKYLEKVGMYFECEAVDIEIIEDFEKILGVKPPKEYKCLAAECNGLIPIAGAFKWNYYHQQGESSIIFLEFDLRSLESIYDHQHNPLYTYENLVTFGMTPSGDCISFDYRDDKYGDDPPVVLILHDQFEEIAPDILKSIIVRVGENFDCFMNGLFDDRTEADFM